MRNILNILNKDYVLTIILVLGLIAALAITSEADADWELTDTEHGRVAVLHNMVQYDDAQTPEDNAIVAYILNSPGGYVVAGHDIIADLKRIGKPVYYSQASSIAAQIAVETNAKPLNDRAYLCFHWIYSSKEPKGATTMTAMRDNQRMLNNIQIICENELITQ